MQGPPSGTRMISVLEGASSQGLGVKTQYPARNHRTGGRAATSRLLSQSWTRRVCVSGTASAGSAHY